MKAIQYTTKARKNISCLLYATCANELFVKQAHNIEFFVLAFFVEFNRLFIADSLLMNTMKKQIIEKKKQYLDAKKSFYDILLKEKKNYFVLLNR